MSNLKKMRDSVKSLRESGDLVQFKNKLAKFNASDKKSRVLAIAAFCTQCMGCEDKYNEPNFKQAIRDCTSYECPLYVFRPYK